LSAVVLLRRALDGRETAGLARSLAPRLAGLGARALVYLGQGGQEPGLELADALGLPACRLDIRYPLSRIIDGAPAWSRPALFAIKELAYRATMPGPTPAGAGELPEPSTRVILFDDSASSGRTIRTALRVLAEHGIPRECVTVAVLRCGRGARAVVDHYATAARVRMAR